jgi:hypothetical protein
LGIYREIETQTQKGRSHMYDVRTRTCAYMLSEAGAVACCGRLAACVFEKLSSSNYAIDS